MKKILIPSFFIFAASLSFGQGVGINNNGANPANSAMLDVVATDKGILVPRVALTATNAAGPITAPATSLLVYNTATAGAGATAVTPGFYYWDGAAWQRFDVGNNTGDWKILGNANTTAATNFLGTTNAQGLTFRTNNTIRFRIPVANQVHAMANGTGPLPFYSWENDPNTGMSSLAADQLNWSTGGAERLRLTNTQLATTFLGLTGAPAYSFTGDLNTGMWRPLADNLSISTAGIETMRSNTTVTSFMREIQTRQTNANAGDILVRLYDSADDGVIDIYRNNIVDTRIHANGNSFYNPNGAVNRVFMIGHQVPYYPLLDMFECNSTGANHYSVNGYNTTSGVAVYGENLATGFAIYGQGNGAANWAGYFDGDLNVTGGYFNFSDKKLKENIAPVNNVLSDFKKINVYSYNYISGSHGLDSTTKRYGFIAQEFINVFPDMVKEKPIANTKENVKNGLPISETALSVTYTELIPLSVKAIQELQLQVEALQKQVKELEEKLK